MATVEAPPLPIPRPTSAPSSLRRSRPGRIAPFARAAAARAAAGGSGGPAGLQPLQQQLQQHIDREDRRIKELTEGGSPAMHPAAVTVVLPVCLVALCCFSLLPAPLLQTNALAGLHVTSRAAAAPLSATPPLPTGILYDFFPAALRAVLPPGSNPASGLSPDAARSVAAAALAVATLMNAPPGFLEFLLCVPWADLGPLYMRPEREEGGGELVIPQASGVC